MPRMPGDPSDAAALRKALSGCQYELSAARERIARLLAEKRALENDLRQARLELRLARAELRDTSRGSRAAS